MDRDVAVVIGIGGMGRAIAGRIGSGRSILLADFDEAALTAVAAQLRDAGHLVTARVVDVADQDSVRSLADAAAALGPVTHLAHTAGLSPTQATAERILRVDLAGVAYVLDEFARVIAPGGAGVVVASMAAHMSGAHFAEHDRALAATPAARLLALPFLSSDELSHPTVAYALAKHANVLRVQAAAGAWGTRGARVNSISPGIISTPMGQQELDGATGEHMRAMVQMSATGRLGTPDDIAAATAFLLDPQTSFVTGTDLLVDGGVVAAARALAPAE
ncbi:MULTISPECIES: SDR family oxidoreductase [Nocardia]|uniref:SDR family oxidoreductase n=1 Tax=Nocardia TaxID=1817 RepID=UPI000D68544F|nr:MULTISPECIES: SDR family oxidoreductase [Nocardia]